jgi:hypothetical protein
MGYGLSFWPIPVMAAIESQIATGFGNPAQAVWFIPAWTLSITVCFMIWYVADPQPRSRNILTSPAGPTPTCWAAAGSLSAAMSSVSSAIW